MAADRARRHRRRRRWTWWRGGAPSHDGTAATPQRRRASPTRDRATTSGRDDPRHLPRCTRGRTRGDRAAVETGESGAPFTAVTKRSSSLQADEPRGRSCREAAADCAHQPQKSRPSTLGCRHRSGISRPRGVRWSGSTCAWPCHDSGGRGTLHVHSDGPSSFNSSARPKAHRPTRS